jgi:hypothetical protein
MFSGCWKVARKSEILAKRYFNCFKHEYINYIVFRALEGTIYHTEVQMMAY